MKRPWRLIIAIVILTISIGTCLLLFTWEEKTEQVSESSQQLAAPPENTSHKDSLEDLASHLGIPSGALDAIFVAIRTHEVPPAQVHQVLPQKTQEFSDLRKQIAGSGDNEALIQAMDQGAFQEAEKILTRALDAARQDSSQNPTDEIRVLARLGRLCNLRLEYTRAAEFFREAAQASGSDNLAMKADLLGWAGSSSLLAGDFQNAEAAYKESLAISEKAFAPTHPAQVNALNNLAGFYRTRGNYGAAEPLYLKALDIRKQALGEEHPSVAAAMNSLAGLYQTMGDSDQAMLFLKESLAIKEASLGPNDPAVIASLVNIANLHQFKGELEQALELLLRSLDIVKESLGAEHPQMVLVLNNLARLSKAKGDKESARDFYILALAISEKALGSAHPDVAVILINLAELDMETDRLDKAEILWRKALKILENSVGAQHPDIHRIQAQLAAIRKLNARNSLEQE